MTIDILIPVYNQEQLIVQAVKSVPRNCKIIICDDGSTDNTLRTIEKLSDDRTITLLSNDKNRGIGYTLKKLMDNATSDYICQLDSDDYFLPEVSEVINQLNGEDLVFYNIKYSDGRIRKINPKTVNRWVGNGKFIRREFLGDIRPNDVRIHEDQYVHKALMAKNPTCKFTDIFAYYYNKRVGSLTYEYFKKG
jgi:glycosyltransferase involved in cell wall biosynthesis